MPLIRLYQPSERSLFYSLCPFFLTLLSLLQYALFFVNSQTEIWSYEYQLWGRFGIEVSCTTSVPEPRSSCNAYLEWRLEYSINYSWRRPALRIP